MPGHFAVANTISHGGNKRVHVVAQFNERSRALVRCARFVERNEKRCNAFGLALHNFRIQAFHVVEVLKHGAHRNLGPLGNMLRARLADAVRKASEAGQS